MEDTLIVGELSLDGTVRHTKGILPMAALARELGFKQVIVPAINADEAALMPGINVLPVEQLSDLVGHLTGLHDIPPHTVDLSETFDQDLPYTTDFADIMGQEHVKRAMEIAAAGGHNALVSWTTTRCILPMDYSQIGREGI